MFLTLTVVGLVGLFMMAMPAFGRHGHVPLAHGSRTVFGHRSLPHSGSGQPGGGRAILDASSAGAAASAASAAHEIASAMPLRVLRFIPSPRAICSVLALYGAFGNALVRAGHLSFFPAALAAVLPALLVEYSVVRPVWNLLFRFQGQPSSSLEALLFSEARALVPFRNRRGIVSVERDGRVVQLVASLRDDHAMLPVRVGDRLRIEDVDARHERVTVSVVSDTRQF